MKKLFLFLGILTLAIVAPAHADSGVGQYGQYGQYGGGSPSASIMVDKTVSRGTTTKGGITQYVDNYSPADPRFTAGDKVYFQVKVKNTSSTNMTNVNVSDILPDYVDAVEGPGDYNADNRTITWTYPELKAGEGKIEKIVVQIKPQAQLPADKGMFCASNKATAQAAGARDEDTAQFCIEKQVQLTKGGVPEKTPEAGAEGLLVSALSSLTLAAGIYLRKRV